MEFPNLGEKCTWPSCKTLDFLPITCSYCKLIFCKNHFNPNSHACTAEKNNKRYQVDVKSFVCSSVECAECSPVEMLCTKCQKHFCLTHRYHDCFDVVENLEAKKQMWKKPEQQFNESAKSVNDTINKKIKKAMQDPKKQATALKIQLMRLKGKAEGSSNIPSSDRIYFLIMLPKGSTKSSKAVFVSKVWSVGKAIDSISNICKVINKNNESDSPKLRLFKSSNGEQISNETSVKINDLIEKDIIVNGESLILEYVNHNEDLNSFVLNNIEEYSE